MKKTNKAKLTKSIIDKACYLGDGKSRCFYWDTEIKGFAVRVYPSNTKSFVLSYRHQGQLKSMVLGQVGQITLEKARELAHDLHFQHRKGEDPLRKKKEHLHQTKMKDLCTDYMQNHAKEHKKSYQQDQKRIDRYIVPEFGSRNPADITPADVQKFHQRIGQHHKVQANRVLDLLQAILNKGIAWGHLPPTHPNACLHQERYKEQKRSVKCSIKDLATLIAAIKEQDSLILRSYFLFLLFTGLRRSEAASLRWQDIDVGTQTLILPDSKGNKPHTLPLNQLALEILNNIPKQKDNPFVFWSNRSKTSHIVEPKKAWHSIRQKANMVHLTIHDMRRTHASALANLGVGKDIVAEVLNQTTRSITDIYAIIDREPVREAENVFAEKIGSLLKAEKVDTSGEQ